jgi:hypothetical protein
MKNAKIKEDNEQNKEQNYPKIENKHKMIKTVNCINKKDH